MKVFRSDFIPNQVEYSRISQLQLEVLIINLTTTKIIAIIFSKNTENARCCPLCQEKQKHQPKASGEKRMSLPED